MDTTVDEMAREFSGVDVDPGITDQGFTFNQFLLTGEEPFLFHCGMRQLFPLVSKAIERVVPLKQLRWNHHRPGRRVGSGAGGSRHTPPMALPHSVITASPVRLGMMESRE